MKKSAIQMFISAFFVMMSCKEFNKETSISLLDDTYLLRDFIGQENELCFKLTPMGLAAEDIPPGKRNKEIFDSLKRSDPALLTCDPELIRFIILHFRGKRTLVLSKCWYDYKFELRKNDSTVYEGEMNLQCKTLSPKDGNYELDSISFEEIRHKMKDSN